MKETKGSIVDWWLTESAHDRVIVYSNLQTFFNRTSQPKIPWRQRTEKRKINLGCADCGDGRLLKACGGHYKFKWSKNDRRWRHRVDSFEEEVELQILVLSGKVEVDQIDDVRMMTKHF